MSPRRMSPFIGCLHGPRPDHITTELIGPVVESDVTHRNEPLSDHPPGFTPEAVRVFLSLCP